MTTEILDKLLVLTTTPTQHGQKVKIRFSVLGASNEKFIFFQCYCFRQLIDLQNDILKLHVALAKKMLYLFEKYRENPILRGSMMRNFFSQLKEILETQHFH